MQLISSMSEEDELLRHSWETGVLAWMLRPHQLALYETMWDAFEKFRERPTLDDDLRMYTNVASRKIGKSYIENLMAFEIGIRFAGSIVRIAAPTQIEANEIFGPMFPAILETCPAELRPAYRQKLGAWVWPNGSLVYVKGVDLHPDRHRGPSSDAIFVDEAAYVRKLKYLVESVLYPQTIHSKGVIFLNSTLNPSPNSEFNDFHQRCKAKSQFSVIPIYAAGFTSQQIAAEKAAVSEMTFRVEYECIEDRDPDKTVVPEWTPEVEAECVRPPPDDDSNGERAYYDRYLGADFGTVDNTALVTGYYDFRAATLYVTGESVFSGALVETDHIAKVVDALETADDEARPMAHGAERMRVGDTNIELLLNLAVGKQVRIRPVVKGTLEGMINTVRVWIKQKRIVIAPECVNLIGCLNHAAWVEKRATKADGPRVRALDRSALTDKHGVPYAHFDALMALVYLVITLERRSSRNPLPETFVPKTQELTTGPYKPERYFMAKQAHPGQNTGTWLTNKRRK